MAVPAKDTAASVRGQKILLKRERPSEEQKRGWAAGTERDLVQLGLHRRGHLRVRVPEEVAREGLLRPGLSAVVRVDTRTGADRSVLDRASAPRPASTASR